MTDDNMLEDLESLRKAIDQEKIQMAACEVNLEKLRKQLKEKFNLDSIEEATKRIGQLEEDSKELGKEVEKAYKKLKESYDW